MQLGDDLQPLAPQQLNTELPPAVQNMARALAGGAQNVFNLPQRFMESSESMRHGGPYDPAPAVDLMQLMVGGPKPFGSAGVFGGKLPGASKPGLRLERVGEPEPSPFYKDMSTHRFNIMDADNRVVGNMSGSTFGGNKFNVGSIDSAVPGHNISDPRVLGTSNIKSLVTALRKEFPDVEEIRGIRITGARAKSVAASRYARMRLPNAPPPTPITEGLTIQKGAPIQSATGQTYTPIHGANFAGQVTPERVMRWLGPND